MHGNFIVKPGKLVVLEGPDGSGKSTQLKRMSALFRTEPRPLLTSQPQGSSPLGQEISRFTNTFHASLDPLALQFLHLASHAQHYTEEILPALGKRAVLMDRCWWSTIAYGFFGADLKELTTFLDFEKFVLLPAHHRRPDLVLFFSHSWTGVPEVKVQNGYNYLAKRYVQETVVVPPLNPSETTRFVIDAMFDRNFLEEGQ